MCECVFTTTSNEPSTIPQLMDLCHYQRLPLKRVLNNAVRMYPKVYDQITVIVWPCLCVCACARMCVCVLNGYQALQRCASTVPEGTSSLG